MSFHRRTLRPWLALAVVTLAQGCEAVTDEHRWPVYDVRGRVTDQAGAAVAGATIWISAWFAPCDRARGPATRTGPFTTGRDGAYHGGFTDPTGHFTGCLDVEVDPPGGRGLAPTTASRDSVLLTDASGGPRRVVIDVRLPGATTGR